MVLAKQKQAIQTYQQERRVRHFYLFHQASLCTVFWDHLTSCLLQEAIWTLVLLFNPYSFLGKEQQQMLWWCLPPTPFSLLIHPSANHLSICQSPTSLFISSLLINHWIPITLPIICKFISTNHLHINLSTNHLSIYIYQSPINFSVNHVSIIYLSYMYLCIYLPSLYMAIYYLSLFYLPIYVPVISHLSTYICIYVSIYLHILRIEPSTSVLPLSYSFIQTFIDKVLLSCPAWSWAHFVASADFELAVLLPQFPSSWNYRPAPSVPADTIPY